MNPFGVQPLHTESLHCYVDEAQHILYIVYQGVVTAETTAQAYGWMMRHATPEIIAWLRGALFDFRKVTRFAVGNLSAVQKKSREINTTQRIETPIAMVVQQVHQEQMVYIGMKVSPNETNKRMVRTVEEATAFFNEYNEARGFAPSQGVG